MSSSAKVQPNVPVSTTATLNKLTNGKFVAASSQPVQEAAVSTDVGTMTDHHLPNNPEDMRYFPFDADKDDEKRVQGSLAFDAPPVFDDSADLFNTVAAMNAHETLQHIGTYEANMETLDAGVKKSTKAFG